KVTHSLGLCIGLLVAVLSLTAQQPPPSAANETSEARVERLIRELDSPRYAVRDRATRELRRLGAKAIAPLDKALAAPPRVEFERRVHLLLERFLPRTPRPLSLQDRLSRMAGMQVQIYDDTRALAQVIEGNPDKKPTPGDRQVAVALANKQTKIIRE